MKHETSLLPAGIQAAQDPFHSNIEMLIETVHGFERILNSSDPCSSEGYAVINDRRLAASSFDTIPLAALVHRNCLSIHETRFLMTLFYIAISPKFRSHFEQAVGGNYGTSEIIRIPFRTVIEVSRMNTILSSETIFRFIDLNSTLVAKHLVQLAFDLERDDTIENPDVSISPDTVRLISGSASSCESIISIERPTTRMDQVILPPLVKAKLMTMIENHDEIQRIRIALELDSTIEYGQSTVILFHGQSGTGKTMLARAISNHTGMPLITPRQSVVSSFCFSASECADALEHIFFETECRNGILFFDECEILLEEHSTELQQMLRQIEKTRCIVILSTNFPGRICASFDRRIALKIKFELPDASQRYEIWKTLIPPKVRCAEDVDLNALSMLFPMTGGYIKNAILCAINRAIHRNPREPCLTQGDLEEACRNQESHLGAGSKWRKLGSVSDNLDSIYLSASDLVKARRIARRISKFQKILGRFGSRGSALPGPKILLQAASTNRAKQIALAIGAEISPVVCVIEARDVLSEVSGGDESESTVQALSRVMTNNAGSGKVIVINNAEALLGHAEEPGSEMMTEAIRDMLLKHSATVICISNSEFKLPKTLVPHFIEQFRESTCQPERLLRTWTAILGEFSLGLPADADMTQLVRYPLDPDEIRSVILCALWEGHDDGQLETIPVETLVQLSARHHSKRRFGGFDITN